MHFLKAFTSGSQRKIKALMQVFSYEFDTIDLLKCDMIEPSHKELALMIIASNLG